MWQKVIIISECEKKTWKKSQAILDKYLYRIGHKTWSGKMSSEGLKDLREKLIKIRTKNMSITARIITRSGEDKIIWRIGNQKHFSNDGFYSIKQSKYRRQNMNRTEEYNILLNATILAACFHDFGKMTNEFQLKLKHSNANDRFRHELISLYIFQYVYEKKKKDKTYDIKNNMKNIFNDIIEKIKENLEVSNVKNVGLNIFNNTDTIKQIISWLIISHHKIPKSDTGYFDAIMELYAHENNENVSFSNEIALENFINSDYGEKLFTLIDECFNNVFLYENNNIKLDGLLSYGRISLTMADHYFSSLKRQKKENDDFKGTSFTYVPINKDKNSIFYANTGKNENQENCLVQPLDCHLHNVAIHTKKILRNIFDLNQNLPYWNETEKPEYIKQPVINENKFDWQYYAHEQIKNLENKDNGFIGFMMAGTGSGKTLCNMILMSEIQKETRFTVALGLRSLTLQTGTEYKNILGEDNLSVNIGSEAILSIYNEDNQSFQNISNKEENLTVDETGSEVDIDQYVFTENCEYDNIPEIIKTYVKKEQYQYMMKPILVTTIDSLMYTEKQPHMALRLMSSDLIIDEIDNYDLIDQGAIMRLVKLSASYGRKVIISSATLPPETAEAMFLAYQEGYKEYCYLYKKERDDINVGWFSEINELNQCLNLKNDCNFLDKHINFVNKMVEEIVQKPVKRRFGILEFGEEKEKEKIFDLMINGAIELHKNNSIIIPDTDKNFSVGFIRIPDVSIVAELTKYIAEKNSIGEGIEHRVLCYHSNFPLMIRDYIEKWLDNACKRKDPFKIFQNKEVKTLIENTKNKNIMIIVVATPVEEVGRDHDFDYMINSLSSTQTLVQGAGRILRHRNVTLEENQVNCLITERPLRAYKKIWKKQKDANSIYHNGPVFMNPGVETVLPDIFNITENYLKLNTTLSSEVIDMEQRIIDSRDCIINNDTVLSKQEHNKGYKVLIKNEDEEENAFDDEVSEKISGSLVISNKVKYFSVGYDNFRFRKGSKNIDLTKEGENWKITSNQKMVLENFKNMNNLIINDNDRYLLSFNEDVLFSFYKEKYFPNKDEELVKNFISSINYNIYKDINTIEDIQKLNLCYSKYLGLYKKLI